MCEMGFAMLLVVLAQVKETRLEVTPGLRVEVVRKVLAEKLNAQTCVPQMLPALKEPLDDRVLVRFTISRDGEIEAGSFSSRGIVSEPCLLSQASALHFPPPQFGERVEVEAGWTVTLDQKKAEAVRAQVRVELDELCKAIAENKGPEEGAKAFLEKRGFQVTHRDVSGGSRAKITQHAYELAQSLVVDAPGTHCWAMRKAFAQAGAKECPAMKCEAPRPDDLMMRR